MESKLSHPPSGLQSCVFGCAHTRTHNTRAHTRTLQGRLAIRKSGQLVALEARPPARGAQCSFSLSRGVCSALRAPEPGQGYEWRKTFQRLEGIPMQPAPFSPTRPCTMVLPGREGRKREEAEGRASMDTWTGGPRGTGNKPSESRFSCKNSALHPVPGNPLKGTNSP